VIISAGAVETPKFLLLSGIGPAADLKSLHVDVVLDLPGIGKNFHDHSPLFMTSLLSPEFSDRNSFAFDGKCVNEAKEQWEKGSNWAHDNP
jgi:choline dehydrogenase-like flavoprotein